MADGEWVSYGYDSGDLTSVTYADGSGYTYVYSDSGHRLEQKKDQTEDAVLLKSWGYDGNGRAESYYTVDGGSMTVAYVTGTETGVTDAYGAYRAYSLEEINGRQRVTGQSGVTGSPYGESEAVSWQYDDLLRLTEVEYASGVTVQYEDFDERGNPGTVIFAEGMPEERVITYTYHPEMNVPLSRTELSVQSGYKDTVWDYDESDSGEPNEAPTMLLYRIIETGRTRDVSGTWESYEYETVFAYNAKGQVTSINGPRPESGGDDDITSFTYDGTSGDLLTIVRPEIGTTSFSGYNDAGLVGTVTDVNSQSTTYDYDGRGRIETITHPDASETAFTRVNGRLTRVTYPDGTYRDFEYNENNGKVSTVTDPEGNYISYTYDARGNRDSMGKYSSGGGSPTYEQSWVYEGGKVVAETDGGNTTIYSYDDAGNVAWVMDPEENTTQYAYDLLGRLKTVTQPGERDHRLWV